MYLLYFSWKYILLKVFDERLPFLLVGIGALLASVLVLFLPETAGVNLPDTIEEAETLFETQGCNPFRKCCTKNPSDKKSINV